MKTLLKKILGPRIPQTDDPCERRRYRRPGWFLATAAIVLLLSIFLPYWRMTLHAPQYPKGLTVQTYVNRLEGDVGEIDGLNHYIGMRPLGEAAQLERSLSIYAISVLALLILGTIFVRSPFSLLLALPALFFPAIFLADLYYWMRNFGLNLDPTAALSGAIKPFVPPVLGEGLIGQFKTVALPDLGLYLATLSSILILIGLYTQRQAFKPLTSGLDEDCQD